MTIGHYLPLLEPAKREAYRRYLSEPVEAEQEQANDSKVVDCAQPERWRLREVGFRRGQQKAG